MFLVETTMALVEDNAVFASRQFDIGNSSLNLGTLEDSLSKEKR